MYFSVPNLIPNTFEIIVPYPWDIILIIGYIIVLAMIMWPVGIKDFTNTIMTFFIFALIEICIQISIYPFGLG